VSSGGDLRIPEGGERRDAGPAGQAGGQQQDYGGQQQDYGGQQQDYGGQQQDYGRQQFEGGSQWPGPMPGGPGWGEMPGRPPSPVGEGETRVTGRRVAQYIIDYAITAAVASLIVWLLDRGSGAGHALLLLLGAVVDAAWYFWYWVYRPYRAGGQSFGMQLLGLRIISKDGSRASIVQLLIRGVLLIVDTLVWGLVGLITILCSRYRQRVGDHAARTLVVRAQVQPMSAPRPYVGAGAGQGS
jgi:uncharacterized RDD family membrane protein YckC